MTDALHEQARSEAIRKAMYAYRSAPVIGTFVNERRKTQERLYQAIEAALRAVQQETLRQDANWMWHNEDCPMTRVGCNGFKSRLVDSAHDTDCTCGLAARLKELEP